jgi:hypothetical protein
VTVGRSSIHRGAIDGRKVHWLLELSIGERVYRYAVDDVDVEDAHGESYRYASGLADLQVVLSVDAAPRATVEVTGEDWALLVARGLDLASGRAVLRRWFEGQVLEESRVVVEGRVVDPEYGSHREPLGFGIESLATEKRSVPPPAAAIDSRTWPVQANFEPDERVLGACYPWPFGSPGYNVEQLWGSVALSAPATPAYLAEFGGGAHLYRSSRLVCADASFGLAAATVTVIDITGGYRPSPYQDGGSVLEEVALATTEDALGRLVAYPDWTLPKNVILMPGHEYWIAWTGGGGILNRERTAAMRGAGEICEFILEQGGVKVARGKQAVANLKLNRFKFDFALVEPTDPERFVEDEVGEIIPLIRRQSADGVWYELWPFDATPKDAVAVLVVGDSDAAGIPVDREGAVRFTGLDDVANEITIEYAMREGDHPMRRDVVGATGEDGERGSYLCRLSQSRYGKRSLGLSTRLVWEAATAGLILDTQALDKALPRRDMDVDGGLELEVLDPGAIVQVVDDELYLDAELAIVLQMRLGLSKIGLELRLLDHPVQSRRAT